MEDIRVYSTSEIGERVPSLVCGRDLWVEVTVAAAEDIPGAELAFTVFASTNEQVIDVNLSMHDKELSLRTGQRARVTFHLRDVLLKPDVYRLNMWLGKRKVEAFDWIKLAASFSVQPEPGRNRLTQFTPGFYRCRYSEEIVLDGPPG